MTDFEIGDENYVEETNTSYDQDQPIGDEPQALYTEPSNSEPIDAETGDDFLDIDVGEEKFKSRDQQQWYYATDQDFLDDEPHEARKVVGESLNKDGTGVKKATRGVDPKNTPAKTLSFVYISKSDCEICKQYDGKTFSVDSPNRPIIPRLESQGKNGTRPYTHPNCKCKWVRPFSKNDMKNFDQLNATEDVLDPLPLLSIAKLGS